MIDVKRMVVIVAAAAALLSIGGCAKSFVAPPGMLPEQYAYIDSSCHMQGAAAGSGTGIPTSTARRLGARLAEEAAAALVSGIAAAIDSNSVYNQCMEASGAIDADRLAKAQLASAAPYAPVTQPVSLVSRIPPGIPGLHASYAPPPDRRAERSMLAASQWITAERILDETGSDRRKRDLYLVLCGAGDETSCIWAAALSRSLHDRL